MIESSLLKIKKKRASVGCSFLFREFALELVEFPSPIQAILNLINTVDSTEPG
jgi:hypothetical protein